MGLISIPVVLDRAPAPEALLRELKSRTGLVWTASVFVFSKGTRENTLRVEPFGWEVGIIVREDKNVVHVEAMPLNWPSTNYHIFQALAVLRDMGGLYVSPDGSTSNLVLPKWADKKWEELPWWRRYSG